MALSLALFHTLREGIISVSVFRHVLVALVNVFKVDRAVNVTLVLVEHDLLIRLAVSIAHITKLSLIIVRDVLRCMVALRLHLAAMSTSKLLHIVRHINNFDCIVIISDRNDLVILPTSRSSLHSFS